MPILLFHHNAEAGVVYSVPCWKTEAVRGGGTQWSVSPAPASQYLSCLLTEQITSIVVEHPTANGPYGAKGVGEIVSIPTTPAITNAIYNAVGVRIDNLPVDQEEIVRQYSALKSENLVGE